MQFGRGEDEEHPFSSLPSCAPFWLYLSRPDLTASVSLSGPESDLGFHVDDRHSKPRTHRTKKLLGSVKEKRMGREGNRSRTLNSATSFHLIGDRPLYE